MISGNDVSKFQGQIDWNTYKSNTNFVILKASEGVGFVDPAFKTNQSEARRVGLPLGYYHFVRPDIGNTPQAEADFFLNTISTIIVGEQLHLDFEVAFSGDVVGWCKAFLDRCFQKTGIRPMIYLNQAYAKQYNWKPVVTANYALWLAAYTNNPSDTNFSTGAWPEMAMRQWTSAQRVPGIIGNVDGNVFYGDVDTFKKYGYPGSTPPPADWEARYKAEVEKNKILEAKIMQAKLVLG